MKKISILSALIAANCIMFNATTVVAVHNAKTIPKQIHLLATAKEFNDAVSRYPYMLIELFADYCSHCQQAKIPFETVAHSKEFSKIEFARIDIEKMSDFAQEHGVQSIPTFWYFKDGVKIHSEEGVKDSNLLESHLRELLKKFFPTQDTFKKKISKKRKSNRPRGYCSGKNCKKE